MTNDDKFIKFVLAPTVGIVGCSLLWYSLGWVPVAAVFLLMWANNMSQYRT